MSVFIPNMLYRHKKDDTITIIRQNIIGARCQFTTPFGKQEMVYADYTASGRLLKPVEDYMIKIIGPMYANTHTEASITGAQTNHFREEARDIIHKALNAPKSKYAVFFTGTGSTGAIDKLFRMLGFSLSVSANERWKLSETCIPMEERPVIFISHLEHHSNELIWRESIARCIVIDEDKNGLPDLGHLERELSYFQHKKILLIGSFSAGSNVTGIRTPTHAIAKLLHRYGAYAFFDYAGVGAYVDINIDSNGSDEAMDGVFLSPHKFIGGPGSSGVLVARRSLLKSPLGVCTNVPTLPGGGTVTFVNERKQTYAKDIETREDAGTPGILQCIRAGLAFQVKQNIGPKRIENLEKDHSNKALSNWKKSSFISLIGSDRGIYFDMSNRVSIISFNVLSPLTLVDRSTSDLSVRVAMARVFQDIATRSNLNQHHQDIKDLQSSGILLPLHFNFVITLLNDLYGIQGRGGCSCAGPYGHRLFGVREEMPLVVRMHDLSIKGFESFKLGWARLNLGYFISDDEINFIIEAVNQIAIHGWKLLPHYIQDISSGQFIHRKKRKASYAYSLSGFDNVMSSNEGNLKSAHCSIPRCKKGKRNKASYKKVLKRAISTYKRAEEDCLSYHSTDIMDFTNKIPKDIEEGDIWWLRPSEALTELLRQKKQKGIWRLEKLDKSQKKQRGIWRLEKLNDSAKILEVTESSDFVYEEILV